MREDSNKHIIEEIVRQVGHLLELYEDARSERIRNLVMQNKQNKYTNTRTSKQNCITTMQLSAIIKPVE